MLKLEGKLSITSPEEGRKKGKRNKTGEQKTIVKRWLPKEKQSWHNKKRYRNLKKNGQSSGQWTSMLSDKWKPRGRRSDKCNGKGQLRKTRAKIKAIFSKVLKKLLRKPPQRGDGVWVGHNLWLSLNNILLTSSPSKQINYFSSPVFIYLINIVKPLI